MTQHDKTFRLKCRFCRFLCKYHIYCKKTLRNKNNRLSKPLGDYGGYLLTLSCTQTGRHMRITYINYYHVNEDACKRIFMSL